MAKKKDINKKQEQKRMQLLSNKRKRIYKRSAKTKEELLLERNTNPKIGTYASGIGVNGPTNEKRRNKIREYCTCGGNKPHKNVNSIHCMLVATVGVGKKVKT